MRVFISVKQSNGKPGQSLGAVARVTAHAVWNIGWAAAVALGLAGMPEAASAAQAVNCGGAAMAGGAELMCSHVQPAAPPQFCTYSWSLMTTTGTASIVQGSFLLAPGASNQPVYQGYGFNSALSNPIVLCQGRRS